MKKLWLSPRCCCEHGRTGAVTFGYGVAPSVSIPIAEPFRYPASMTTAAAGRKRARATTAPASEVAGSQDRPQERPQRHRLQPHLMHRPNSRGAAAAPPPPPAPAVTRRAIDHNRAVAPADTAVTPSPAARPSRSGAAGRRAAPSQRPPDRCRDPAVTGPCRPGQQFAAWRWMPRRRKARSDRACGANLCGYSVDKSRPERRQC